MAESGPGNAGGYVAFISYSHKDAAMGRWLHRKLEGYRLPKRLAGTRGEDGEVPARLTPIFRDRDELPAAGDLSERVRAALAVSRNLIVLCSPNSADSPWVAKEIATFREIHPGRPIFTAIVEGEPGQCFSPALLQGGGEPLAADLRRAGDGKRLGLLKLVAGLAGVGLDALVQRDAQRRIRRVTYVTALAGIAMLAMALLTAFAFNARAEAQRQRAEAEGLVEFMLTDLRDRLKGVGRLDVLAAANQRALAYYQRQDLDSLPTDSLERRSHILLAMGEDDERRGDLKRALGQFQEAARTTGQLVAQAPSDPNRIYSHAQSEFWLGLIAWRQNDPKIAEMAFTKYRQLALRLASMAPDNLDWSLEVAYANSSLGTVLLRQKGFAKAADALFVSALQRFGKVAQARPEDKGILSDIADGYGWLADAQRVQGFYDKAMRSRKSQEALLTSLLSHDAANAVYKQELIGARLGIAQLEISVGNYDSAQQVLRLCVTDTRRLLSIESLDVRTLSQQSLCKVLLAKLALMQSTQRSITQDDTAILQSCKIDDGEIAYFCRLLAVSARSTSTETAGGSLSNKLAPPPWSGRYSPRWGLNLPQEAKI